MWEKIGDDKDESEVGPTSVHLNLHQSSPPISLLSSPFQTGEPRSQSEVMRGRQVEIEGRGGSCILIWRLTD